MNEAQDALLVHDEVTAELGGVIAVRVVELAALELAFDGDPDHTTMAEALKIAAISYFKDPAKLSCCAE